MLAKLTVLSAEFPHFLTERAVFLAQEPDFAHEFRHVFREPRGLSCLRFGFLAPCVAGTRLDLPHDEHKEQGDGSGNFRATDES
ncbi:hypothetical protein ACFQ7F_13000 [Streptomyces sp. NPDC056486]|uniref:hypothetical protein n=1 Tax=Streptomyces sp. NPDC056486 TaxID=3345835 RepID=UPI0036D0DD0D